MLARTRLVPVSLALALAACGGKKEAPAAGSGAGSTAGTGSGTAAPVEPVRPPPPPAKPLPPLAADPGGATGNVTTVTSVGGVKTDTIRALAAAADGGVFAVGYFEDEAKLGAITATATGKSDAFAARLDPSGAVGWVVPLGGPNEDVGDAIAVAADGTVAFGGLFSGRMRAGDLVATSLGSDDLFVAGVTATGELRWIWSAGGEASDATTALVAAPDGGFVAAVAFGGKATFGTTELATRGYEDAALVKLSGKGEVQWVTHLGGAGVDQIKRLATDANGNLFVLATFQDELDVGGGKLTAAGANDLLIARFDASGGHVWSKRVGNPFNELAGGIAVDQSGGVVVTGAYDKEVDFLGTPLVSTGESDIFVARLAPDGALTWVKSFGSPREDVGYGIAVDPAGNAVLTGWFETPVDFGGGPLQGKGQKDGFIAKLTLDGKHVWSRRFGDWDHDSGNAVAIASDGTPWLAGIYRYTLDLQAKGPTSAKAPDARQALPDAFVAHFER